MKKTILVLMLVLLVLTGCSGGKEEQAPTTQPTQAVTEAKTEPGAVITAPTEITVPATIVPPVTETVPPATTAPAASAPAIVITKNPSSETVSAGGRTWFIASAENETQITWEFFSPDGTMYSLQQTMSAHPGLVLEVLPEDTLGLRQIPASFNGWSARARYDGPGGTATTNRATITVRDTNTASAATTTGDPYSNIIEAFRAVRRAGSGNREKDISELVNDYEFLGYAKKDLDGNGVEELILASDGDCYLPYVVYDVYTIENGRAVKVVSSRARERYFLLADGRFLLEGSSGAMSSCWITYQFINGSVAIDEQIYTSEEPHDLADFAPYYYYCDNLYGVSDPMVYDDAARTIESWEWQITLPYLTPIN